MKLLELTLGTPEENMACDEALLLGCEEGECDGVLRFWETSRYFVVAGYSNRVPIEVNVNACQADHIPVLRRCSGGGAVLQGPGCLNYALIVRINDHHALGSITGANRFFMNRNREALGQALGLPIEVRGHTDLVTNGRKFSGNSQRRLRRSLLFHGCFLLDLNLDLVERYLRMPSRAPEYRQNRRHADFLLNLGVSAEVVKKSLRVAWQASEDVAPPSAERISKLVREKYSEAEPTAG
jgi:lipoate---protein ligase